MNGTRIHAGDLIDLFDQLGCYRDAAPLIKVANAAYAYRHAVKRAKPFDVVTQLAKELDEALRAFDWDEAA